MKEITVQTQDFISNDTLGDCSDASLLDHLHIINNYAGLTKQVPISLKQIKNIKHWEIVNQIEQWLIRNLLWDMIKKRILVTGKCHTFARKKGSPVVVKVNLQEGSVELDSRAYTAATRTFVYPASAVLRILKEEDIPKEVSIRYQPNVINPINFQKRKSPKRKGQFESRGSFEIRTFEPETP